METGIRKSGDFTADRRLVGISAVAIFVGAACAFVAVALLKLIAFFTNLFFYQRLSFADVLPADHHLGAAVILVPAAGALLIGLMARYGSERIRGHGIPEAIEAILFGRSKMEPKVAILKPLSSAISIGSGGPFGAEGPIIMTGGAFGSIIAQLIHLTAAERKTLLVAGAAGGMSATFATPVAAVLLAVELLLFELKPRSLVPVALASAVAAAVRPYVLGSGPLFPVSAHAPLGPAGLVSALAVGLAAGATSALLTKGVYLAEDSFQRFSIHWMWWPAIGGLVVGIGGYVEPRSFGVGYDVIRDLLQGNYVASAVLGLMVVKAVIWATSLGSGTSGGVLAPLLIIGGSIGALAAGYLPEEGRSLWPLVGMGAILGGTMRSPLTGIVFATELTHDIHALLPLLLASIVAHGFTVLVMPRSILTEKVARRGYQLSREYAVDPLEGATIEEVMTRKVVTVPASLLAQDLLDRYFDARNPDSHLGYPVLDEAGRLVGMVTRSDVLSAPLNEKATVADLFRVPPIVATPDETCRAAADRMASAGIGRLPVVVMRNDPNRVVGIVTLSDLLKARARMVESEQRRERLFRAPPRSTAR